MFANVLKITNWNHIYIRIQTLYWLLYHKGLIGRVLQRLLSFWKVLPSPQRNSRALSEWPSDSWSPPWPRPFSPRLLSLATVFLGTFNAAGMFWYPSTDLCLDTILSRSSRDTSFNLMAWLLLWHSLSTVGPYIDRYVPFQIMFNQLNLPQEDSNQVVETSQGWAMETGCTWAQFRVS